MEWSVDADSPKYWHLLTSPHVAKPRIKIPSSKSHPNLNVGIKMVFSSMYMNKSNLNLVYMTSETVRLGLALKWNAIPEC